MGDHSQIQWTDATWNPVTGCSKVSPGCAHCYAEGVAARFWKTQYPSMPPRELTVDSVRHGRPREFTDVMTHEDRLDQPLRWKKPRKVFVNSMSDLFHEDVPDDFIDKVFAVMALAPQHTFQILTKRAARMRDYLLTLTGSVERMDDRKGGDPSEWPADLRVRSFPEVRQ
jgi:protein gp37